MLNIYDDISNIKLPHGKILKFTDSDSYPFFLLDFVFYIGEPMGTHKEIMDNIIKENPKIYIGNSVDFLGTYTDHDGRIWLKDKVVAFYEHIKDKYILHNIIDELENYFKIKIDLTEWYIVVQDTYDTISNYISNSNKENIINIDREDHIKSPMDKTKNNPTKYIKEKPIEWRYAMGENNIIKFNSYINESINYIDFENKKLKYNDNDAYAFVISDGQDLIISKESGKKHIDIVDELIDSMIRGRLWLNSKLISFWGYLEPRMLKQIIKNIESELNIKINYNEWKIDYYDNPEDKNRKFKTLKEYIENINEGVDYLEFPNGDIIYYDSISTFPILTVDNEVLIGPEGESHGNFIANTNLDIGNTDNFGRLWIKYNTISFWGGMTLNLLLNIIKQIENKLEINITDDWNIEYYDETDTDEHGNGGIYEIFTTIDKMKKYEKGKKLKITKEEYDKRLQAHLNPDNKDRNHGSPLTSWDSKKPLPYRQAIYQENKIIKFNEYLLEDNKHIFNKINKIIDYTIIKPNIKKEDVMNAIEIVKNNNYYGIVVNEEFLDYTTYDLKDEDIKVITVLDFPKGDMRLDKKLTKTIDLISYGADEIDMVIDVNNFKDILNRSDEDKESRLLKFINDLKPIVNECHKNSVILKIIIEIGLLSLDEIIYIVDVIQKTGIDFIQTSTGMNGDGINISKIKELRRLLPDYVKIKAAGGIRTIDQANNLYPYVDRIGTSVILK